jgi:hypothetical protein
MKTGVLLGLYLRVEISRTTASLCNSSRAAYTRVSGPSGGFHPARRRDLKFCYVALAEFLPATRGMCKPFTQFRAGRDLLEPLIDAGLLFAEPTRPEPIHQYAGAILRRGLFLYPLELNPWLRRAGPEKALRRGIGFMRFRLSSSMPEEDQAHRPARGDRAWHWLRDDPFAPNTYVSDSRCRRAPCRGIPNTTRRCTSR